MIDTPFPHCASPAEAAFEAAVVRGLALIGVLKGFTRRVFGLGRVMREVLVRLDEEGVDPTSANSGFDIKATLTLLRRALHLADALRARLQTTAVALALLRPRSAPAGERTAREPATQDVDAGDPLWRISYGRTDDKVRSTYRQAIAEMSDFEVIERIYTDLMWASVMLGDTEEAAGTAVLARKAAALFDAATEAGAPGAAATEAGAPEAAAPEQVVAPGRADLATSDVGSDPADDVPGARPPPRAVGRGPPF